MSNIDSAVNHTIVDDELVQDLGEAFTRRLANTAPPAHEAPPADGVDEAASPAVASTDSTGSGEDAEAAPTAVEPPVTAQPDADVTGEGAASQSAGSAEGQDGDGAEDQPVTPSPSTFKVDDTEYTADDIKSLTQLRDWATGLSPDLRQALAAVEAGQAAAIPADEYRKFLAWQTAQGSRQQPSSTTDDLLDGLDDDQLRYVRELEARAAGNTTTQRPADPAQVASEQQRIQQQLNERTMRYVDTAKSWGDARGLTEQQVADLTQVAVDHGVFATFAEAGTEFNPVNGQVLREADMADVTTKALNFALANDPGLYTQVLAGQQQLASRAAADSLADTAVSQKKARSASLAAAPSQASVTAPTDVTKLTPDQLKTGMSQFIAQQEGLPQHD